MRNAQYMLRGTSAASPGMSAVNTAADAAWPDEKRSAAFAFSRRAMSASAVSYVGLSARDYTRPPGYEPSAPRSYVVEA